MTVLVWHWCDAVMVLVCLTWNCCGICSMMVNHKAGGGCCCPYQLVLELLLSLQPWWLVSLAPCVASHCARGLLAPQGSRTYGAVHGELDRLLALVGDSRAGICQVFADHSAVSAEPWQPQCPPAQIDPCLTCRQLEEMGQQEQGLS